ncbi:MAG: methyltransferase domain-containing protein [Actinomycetota bacterium]
MSEAAVITIVARNYVSRARVLGASLLRTNPGLRLTALVVDGEGALPAPGADGVRWVAPSALPLDPAEFGRMATIYDVTELCTALKPWALEMMLAEGIATVAYIDPDVAIFGPLDVCFDLGDADIGLTPHCVHPIPRDGLRPTEADLAVAGVYNLGFVSVASGALPMLHWWEERLRRDCLVAFERQLFVDQRWLDQAPALFRCRVIADAGCNVAYWNLHERPLRREGEAVTVSGVPLRFFHFSGLESDRPWVMSKYVADRPRVVMSEHPVAAELCDRYLAEVTAAEAPDDDTAYGFGCFADGTPIGPLMRSVYREAVLGADEGGPEPPPLLGADPASVRHWFSEPVGPGGRVGRLLDGLWRSRPDLRGAFPDPEGRSGDHFTAWALEHAEGQTGIPVGFLVSPGRRRDLRIDVRVQPGSVPGVNLSGYLTAALGIGQVGRLLVDACDEAGLPVSTRVFTATASRRDIRHDERGRFGEHPVNVVVVNADQFPAWTATTGAGVTDDRYTIGVWFWELAHLPEYFVHSLTLVDEVWVTSDYLRRALLGVTDKPVHVMPMPVRVPEAPPPFDRHRLGIPDGPMLLFMFDYFSTVDRKNPLGLIDAFCAAFGDGEGPVLVIKSINGDQARSDRERVRFRARGRSDIVLLEDYLSPEDNTALLGAATAYVSLHRSEGYGLTLAESMALGVPVIATGFSGNLEFMTADDGVLVDYALAPVPPDAGPYPAGATWADPDVVAAAAAMRRVVHDPDWARELGRRGRERIRAVASPVATARFVQERIGVATEVVLERRRGATAPPVSAPAAQARRAREVVGAPARTDTPARFPAIARPLRSITFRALRHHDEQERVRLEALADVTDALVTELDRLRGEINAMRDHHRRSLGLVRNDVEQLTIALRGLRRTVDADLLPATGTLHEGQAAAVAAIEALGSGQRDVHEVLGAIARRLETLQARVRAEPYRSDPGALRITGSDGRVQLGYRGGADADYASFEDIFRGPVEQVTAAFAPYLPLLADRGPVVDLGCGRGELLGLLREHGIEAHGVDTDASMLAVAKRRELDVRERDLLDHLRSLPDESVGAVVSTQVIEHLPVELLRPLLGEVRRVLRVDGICILETVNPHAIDAFKSFWLDLTHVRPLYPEAMLVLAREVGFPEAEIVFPTGTGDLDVDLDVCGAYALVARPSGPTTATQ